MLVVKRLFQTLIFIDRQLRFFNIPISFLIERAKGTKSIKELANLISKKMVFALELQQN